MDRLVEDNMVAPTMRLRIRYCLGPMDSIIQAHSSIQGSITRLKRSLATAISIALNTHHRDILR